MGKNICKESNWQGINLQNTQTAHAVQYKKKKFKKKKKKKKIKKKKKKIKKKKKKMNWRSK
mgnify:CR=1 FL=1